MSSVADREGEVIASDDAAREYSFCPTIGLCRPCRGRLSGFGFRASPFPRAASKLPGWRGGLGETARARDRRRTGQKQRFRFLGQYTPKREEPLGARDLPVADRVHSRTYIASFRVDGRAFVYARAPPGTIFVHGCAVVAVGVGVGVGVIVFAAAPSRAPIGPGYLDRYISVSGRRICNTHQPLNVSLPPGELAAWEWAGLCCSDCR